MRTIMEKLHHFFTRIWYGRRANLCQGVLFGMLVWYVLGFVARLVLGHAGVNAAAAGLNVWLFWNLLHTLTPGTHWKSRMAYTGLVFASAPVFVLSGVGNADHLPLLAVLLLFVWGFVWLPRPKNLPRPVQLGIWVVGWSLGLIPWLLFWGLADAPLQVVFENAGQEALAWGNRWSIEHLNAPAFGNWGKVGSLIFPRWLCVIIFPLLHPGFYLLLAGLLLLSKRTDLHLRHKQWLLGLTLLYVVLLAGGPTDALADLLPLYALLLLLLFPAWDRFFAYGFYFFPKLARMLLLIGVAIQTASYFFM